MKKPQWLWSKLSRISDWPIRTCRLCFEPIIVNDLRTIVDKKVLTCSKCQKLLVPIFENFWVEKCLGLAIYHYDEMIKEKLYLLKGCKDVEMALIFLNDFRLELALLFSNYIIVTIPSWEGDDMERGFNHVVEIFKSLGLKMVSALRKNSPIKQSDLGLVERQKVGQRFELINQEKIYGKSILIVDDVMTTGSSLMAAIKLIKKAYPKRIRLLVMSKTRLKRSFNKLKGS